MDTDFGEKGKKSGLAGTLALILFPKFFTNEVSASHGFQLPGQMAFDAFEPLAWGGTASSHWARRQPLPSP